MSRLLRALLVGLVLVTVAQAPIAASRILWRFTVLSFDSPATQLADELACTSVPATRVDHHARSRLLATPGRLLPLTDPPDRGQLARAGSVTRAPPTT